MRIFYSPLKVPKSVFWLFMALILCFMLVIYWVSVRDGIPQIEQAVRRQVISLSRSEESLRSLELGRTTRTRYKIYNDDMITGYFQLDGSYSNQSCDVWVYWQKADTNSPIDTIKVSIDNQELRTIWSRK
jgi:hypothetical protein